MRTALYLACAAAFGWPWYAVLAAWPTTTEYFGGGGEGLFWVERGTVLAAFAATSAIVALGGRRFLRGARWRCVPLLALAMCVAGALLQPMLMLGIGIVGELLSDPAGTWAEWTRTDTGPFGAWEFLWFPWIVTVFGIAGLWIGLSALPVALPLALVEVVLLRWIAGSRASGADGSHGRLERAPLACAAPPAR